MSNIYKFHLSERDTSAYFQTGYAIAVDAKEALESIDLTCSAVDKPYGENNVGHFTLNISDDIKVDFTFNASGNCSYGVTDGNGTALSDFRTVRINSSDGYQSDCYLCVISYNNKIVIGVNAYDNPLYLFAFGFIEYDSNMYWVYIPYNVVGYDYELELFDSSNNGCGKLRQIYNISINEQNKGLFNNMLITDANNYTDVNAIVPDVYCVKSSYPFVNYETVKINGVEFYPLNIWTLLKIQEGSIVPSLYSASDN